MEVKLYLGLPHRGFQAMLPASQTSRDCGISIRDETLQTGSLEMAIFHHNLPRHHSHIHIAPVHGVFQFVVKGSNRPIRSPC
jgi:hypothetical protein